jgi:hypothetical protein
VVAGLVGELSAAYTSSTRLGADSVVGDDGDDNAFVCLVSCESSSRTTTVRSLCSPLETISSSDGRLLIPDVDTLDGADGADGCAGGIGMVC